ncbi:MAG: RNA polymerase sigma-70 factor [Odoribacteraceae bacterium]|jgi:RNA polymerase sigma-70 factor (ECF subfamily)|nr:RNA polymerase sigma-70 factor [Odoribacteraceae bacterium]
MKNPETHLVELVNRKEQQGFRLLYRDYYRSLVALGMHYTRQRETAEDVVQDLFRALWQRDLYFESLPRLKTFMYTAIKNACLNELKREQTRKEYLLTLPADEPLDDADDRAWIEEEVYRRVILAIERLPDRCREVFEHHLQGKKNEEIAALLHLSVATVKTQKNRALHFLRDEVGPLPLLLFLLRFPC